MPRPAKTLPTVPGRSPEVQAWLERELGEQERRYRRIVREMDALDPRRKKWIKEFYARIQTRGYCVHADIRRKIKPEEIPEIPEGKIKVVW
jgi:hypothetical protein